MEKSVLFGIFAAVYVVSADVSTPHLCLPPPSQKCFTIIQDQYLNWMQAEESCERNLPNGRLASIHNAFATSLISGWLSFMTTDPWIGAIKRGSLPYKWADNTTLDYTNWAPGQPTVSGVPGQFIESCAQVCHSTWTSGGIQCQKGKWTTADCAETTSHYICEYGNYTNSASTTAAPSTTQSTPKDTDCLDIHQRNPGLKSGVYLLSPPGIAPFQAYCDMETDEGGWTVFQRRVDGTVPFWNKTWNEYKYGFNNGLDKNLWLGNEYIHILSGKDFNVDLRIDIWGDRAPSSPYANIYLWQKQSKFYLENENENYMLFASYEIEGNASISQPPYYGISGNIGIPFSTVDNSHDGRHGLCSTGYYLGGWWLVSCTTSTLNGIYIPSSWDTSEAGITWNTGNYIINPTQTRMMLRRAIE